MSENGDELLQRRLAQIPEHAKFDFYKRAEALTVTAGQAVAAYAGYWRTRVEIEHSQSVRSKIAEKLILFSVLFGLIAAWFGYGVLAACIFFIPALALTAIEWSKESRADERLRPSTEKLNALEQSWLENGGQPEAMKALSFLVDRESNCIDPGKTEEYERWLLNQKLSLLKLIESWQK